MVAAFEEANPDISVETIWVQGQYEQQLLTMIAGGTPPDVIQMSNCVPLQNFADQFLPLQGVDESIYAQPFIAESLSIDGELRAIPAFAKPKAMGINTRMFDAAGVAYPSPTEALTPEEFQEIAIAITSGEGDDRVFGSAELWYGQWLQVFGGTFFTEDGTQLTVGSPESIAAANFIDASVNEFNYAPDVVQREGISTLDWWTIDKVAMYPDFGPWHLPTAYAAEDFEWDLVPVPNLVSPVEIDGYGISKDTDEPDAALRLALFMGQDPAAQNILATTPGLALPVTVAGQEAFVASDPDHNLAAFLLNLEQASVAEESCMSSAVFGEFYGAMFDQTTMYGGDVSREFHTEQETSLTRVCLRIVRMIVQLVEFRLPYSPNMTVIKFRQHPKQDLRIGQVCILLSSTYSNFS
jgi:ABC-type glycerol-3-phosphate transport system substrate-binding protein